MNKTGDTTASPDTSGVTITHLALLCTGNHLHHNTDLRLGCEQQYSYKLRIKTRTIKEMRRKVVIHKENDTAIGDVASGTSWPANGEKIFFFFSKTVCNTQNKL